MKYFPIINFILIVLLGITLGLSTSFSSEALDKVQEFELRINEISNNSRDTVVVNITNQIEVPSNFGVTLKVK